MCKKVRQIGQNREMVQNKICVRKVFSRSFQWCIFHNFLTSGSVIFNSIFFSCLLTPSCQFYPFSCTSHGTSPDQSFLNQFSEFIFSLSEFVRNRFCKRVLTAIVVFFFPVLQPYFLFSSNATKSLRATLRNILCCAVQIIRALNH